jgi:hypothetical protein
MYQYGSHRTDFRQISYWEFYEKSAEKLKIWFKPGKHFRHFDADRSIASYNEIAILVLSSSEMILGCEDRRGSINIT